MSSLPLTFNNGQTATTSGISVVKEGGQTIQERGGIAGSISRGLSNEQTKKSYIVTNLVKDGVDKNNRPLYKREIRAFNSVAEAKNFKEVVDRYDQTIFIEEAIHRLVEINYKIGLLEESKKFNAFELSLFSKATIPEKYFEKFFESKLSKLELLECIGV